MTNLRIPIKCIFLSSLLAAGAAHAAADPLCDEILRNVQNIAWPGEPLELIPVNLPDWNLRAPNLDTDGDDKNDEIFLFKTDSPSKMPGDLDKARVTLSSTEKSHLVELPHIGFRRFKSEIYLTATIYTEGGASAQLEAYALGRNGVTQVCSFNTRARG
jgi:hypothetical protein